MKLGEFEYVLPKELIAQRPLTEREKARLLVLNRAGSCLVHRVFKDIVSYFEKGDLLVLNDTRVLPSRLIGRRSSSGKVDLLLLKDRGDLTFDCLIRQPRLKEGERISFDDNGFSAEVISRKKIKFFCRSAEEVYKYGRMPLPPYIKRTPDQKDEIFYQTVYASNDGSVAAPTAGLHFTKELIRQIESSGVHVAFLTLHVGLSTFAPVKSEEIAAHRMQNEYFSIPSETIRLLQQTRRLKKRIFACGTTVCRALETYAASGLSEGETDLFIYPGYLFKATDCLITNFHLPRTTLYILACAFAGTSQIRKAYAQAIALGYRFYSYGDAMLML